jgi:hypothetical protein
MIANAALFTVVILVALLFVGMDVLGYLAPYRNEFLHHHSHLLLTYFGMVAITAYFPALQLARRLGLKGAGTKLDHMEREGVLAEQIRDLTRDHQDR